MDNFEKHFGTHHKQTKQFRTRKNFHFNVNVYRLENSEGIGPFKVTPTEFNKSSRHIVKRMHPLLFTYPYEDLNVTGLYLIGFFNHQILPNLRFACSSISQFKKWMTSSELEEFKKLGYKIYKYKVAVALVSENQCLYNIKDAVKV